MAAPVTFSWRIWPGATGTLDSSRSRITQARIALPGDMDRATVMPGL